MIDSSAGNLMRLLQGVDTSKYGRPPTAEEALAEAEATMSGLTQDRWLEIAAILEARGRRTA